MWANSKTTCNTVVTFSRFAINVGEEEERTAACVLLQFGLFQISHIDCVAHPSLNIRVQQCVEMPAAATDALAKLRQFVIDGLSIAAEESMGVFLKTVSF